MTAPHPADAAPRAPARLRHRRALKWHVLLYQVILHIRTHTYTHACAQIPTDYRTLLLTHADSV